MAAVGALGFLPIGEQLEWLSWPQPEPFLYAGAIPICQGMTNATSAQFTLLVPKDIPCCYRILKSNGSELDLNKWRQETRTDSPWSIVKLSVADLILDQNFRLQVFHEADGTLIDERNFKALDLESPSYRFAVASCMNDIYKSERQIMWQQLHQAQPDFVILNGDTVYADNKTDGYTDHSGGEANFWQRYADAFLRLSHYRMKNLIPTLATWDDHDFGANDGDSSFKEKWITSYLFELYWGNQPAHGLVSGPGVSKVFTTFDQQFFLMDSRSFRTGRGHAKPSHWGATQEDFLLGTLNKNHNPAFIINGSQFFGGYLDSDSFEADQNANMKQMMQQLSRVESPLAFISGDVHFSEVMNLEPALLGYRTFEYTSSSIHSHASPYVYYRYKNPRRLQSTMAHNFMIFESSSPDRGELHINCKCLAKGGAEKFNHSTTILRG